MTIINPKSIAGVTSITTPSGSDNLFTVHTNNTTERVRINNDGDVIVGSGITVSPDGDIFTTGVTTATTFVGALTGNVTGNATGLSGTPNISAGTIAGSTGTFTGDVDIADKIVHTGDTDTALRFPAVNTFTVETAGSERIRIDSDGRVMIGQTSSVVPFMVTATASNFGGMVMTGVLGDATSYASGVGGGLTLSGKYNSGGSQVGFAAIRGLKENGTDGNYNGALTLNTRPNGGNMTERARIDSSGRLMIGTTDASQFNSSADDFVISRAGHAGITIDATSSTNSSVFFADGPTGTEAYRGYVQYSHSSDELRLGAAGTDQVQITSGNVEVVDGDLVIGTSGHGISFAITSNTSATGGSTSNELFDDYEEGTWTPTIAYQYGSVTSYNSQVGKYTKIGNMVYADFFVGLSNKGDPSGSYSYLQGFPFNHTGSTAGTGTINYFANMGTNYSFLAYEMGGSSPTVAWLTGVVGTQATSMSYIGGGNFNNNSYLSGTLIYRVSG